MSRDNLPPPEEVIDILDSVASFGVPTGNIGPVLDIGTGEYVEFFRDELIADVADAGSSFCRFFEGPYGGGKTHLLHLLESMASELGLITVRTDLSSNLNLADWNHVCKFVLANMRLNLQAQDVISLPAILRESAMSGVLDSSLLRGARLPHSGFQAAMAYILEDPWSGDQTRADLLSRFLLGDRVRVSDLRRHGLLGIKDPLSVRNAEQVLGTVIGGLYAAGLPGTMMLFDENERTFQGKSRKVQIAANLMRRLIDGSLDGRLSGAITIFAVLPGFLSACSELYPALGQRIAVSRANRRSEPWRSPVVEVSSVSANGFPEEFGEKAIIKMLDLADYCGVNSRVSTMLEESLSRATVRVLEENAGLGFRRPLMKNLCTLTLRAVEEV